MRQLLQIIIKLKETLDRVSPSYKDPADIKARLRNIKRPHIEKFKVRRQENLLMN